MQTLIFSHNTKFSNGFYYNPKILMKLRKQTVKTEFDEQTCFDIRYTSKLPDSTDKLQVKKTWTHSQKQIQQNYFSKKKFTRFSSETDCDTLTDKAKIIKRVSNLIESNAQIKQSMDFQYLKPVQNVINKQLQVRQKIKGSQTTTNHKRVDTQLLLFRRCSFTKISTASAINTLQKDQISKYQKLCHQVDQVYSKIFMLKQIGCRDQKINRWLLNYCAQRRPILRQCIMAKVALSTQQKLQYQQNSQLVKNKIIQIINKPKKFHSSIEVEEFNELANYLQEIFIQKNLLKVKQVHQTIVDKMSLDNIVYNKEKPFIFTKKESTEVQNFVNDLQIQEDKYGSFKTLTKVNKLRFEQLNKVQKNLKDVYQQLLETEARKLVQQIPVSS